MEVTINKEKAIQRFKDDVVNSINYINFDMIHDGKQYNKRLSYWSYKENQYRGYLMGMLFSGIIFFDEFENLSDFISEQFNLNNIKKN